MEEYIAAGIVKNLMREDYLPALNQCLNNNAETERLRNRLNGTEKKIYNIARNLENEYSETLTIRLRLLEEERDSLTNQLKTASQVLPLITPNNLKKTKRRLVKYLCASDDLDVKELLMTYITEITVSNENVTVDLQI